MILKLLVYLTHPHVDCWNFKPRHEEALKTAFPDLEIRGVRHSKDFLEHLPEADGVIVWFFKREWLDRAPKLRLISTPAAGTDWMDAPDGDGSPGSPVRWHGGFHGPMMAESVLGAALHFLKAFDLSRHLQKKKKWARIKISNELGSLQGARVTILGFGRIGRAIGRVFKPFGCQITGIKRTLDEAPDYFDTQDRVIAVDQISEVLPETDHLILVLPGGEETDHLVSRDWFSLLPGHTCFYNVGRGNPYREEDLVWALEQKKIRFAYLDVFEPEPLPEESPLWDFDNVLIQPHLSAASPQYLDLFIEEWIERMKTQGPEFP